MDSLEMKQIEFIKNTIRETLNTSTKAHDILFKDSHNRQNELIAGILINKSISLISSCKAIYYSNLNILENTYVEEIFFEFDVFSNEFLTSLLTEHSYQWTDIEYSKFKDSVTSFLG